MHLQAFGWAAGLLALGAADLYAVGGGFDSADALLMGLGALPAVGFGLLVAGSRDAMDN